MTARRPPRLLVALVIFVGLGFGEAGAQQPAPPSEPPAPAPHDPLQGMEPSGRIPKVEFPEDLPNPERWRYFPEGRIKPGNIFQRLLVTSFISPQIFFEESIGVGGGVSGAPSSSRVLIGRLRNTGPAGALAASWNARRSIVPSSRSVRTSCAHFDTGRARPTRSPDSSGSASMWP